MLEPPKEVVVRRAKWFSLFFAIVLLLAWAVVVSLGLRPWNDLWFVPLLVGFAVIWLGMWLFVRSYRPMG
jgi:hypothetical protein